MMFTEYKFDPIFLDDRIVAYKEGLKQNQGFSNLLSFGLALVMERLDANPLSYREYGPWWWALKEVMRDNGYDLGAISDVIVRTEYSFESQERILIAAEEFRLEAISTFFKGNNEYQLSSDGTFYYLFDSDIESRVRKN